MIPTLHVDNHTAVSVDSNPKAPANNGMATRPTMSCVAVSTQTKEGNTQEIYSPPRPLLSMKEPYYLCERWNGCDRLSITATYNIRMDGT